VNVIPQKSVGVAWYSAEGWQQLASMPEAGIEKSYQDFVRTFERACREFAVRGVQVEKITIDIDKLVEWCASNGYVVDTKGRAAYGAMLMLARDDPAVLTKPVIDKTRVLQ
jgi:hypothetical protein